MPNPALHPTAARILVFRQLAFFHRATAGELVVGPHTQKDSLMTHDIVTPSPPESSLAQHLLVMALGAAQTAVLCTAAQLGLADHVKDGPETVAALAEATGTHLPTLNPPHGRAGPPGPV